MLDRLVSGELAGAEARWTLAQGKGPIDDHVVLVLAATRTRRPPALLRLPVHRLAPAGAD
jgi:hypothetical protein